MKQKNFKFLEHTADVKFQASGKNIEEAFKNSATAMAEVMTKGIDKKVGKRIKKKIKTNGSDMENLLYNFLEEFLYLLDAENFLFAEVKKIEINGNELRAELLGDNAKSYKFTNDIKAVTYNEMFVKKIKDKWVCQVVLDV